MAGRTCICGVLICSLACAAAAAKGDSPPGKVVLDHASYWRYYVQFGPDRIDAGALKGEGGKLLGRTAMNRLRQKALRYSKPPFAPPGEAIDPAKVDWRDRARVWFSVGQGDSERAALNCRWPAPPADWADAGFDDHAWPRQRLGLLVGNFLRPSIMHGDKDMQQLCVKAACFRASFDVPDPAAGRYVLRMSFRGGARVLVNGTEIARAALPAGALGPDDHGKAYPPEAYVCKAGEVPPKNWERSVRKVGVMFCEDLPGGFEDAFADADSRRAKGQYWTSLGASRFAGYFGGWTPINRKGFERITALRNRTLGAVTIPSKLLTKGRNVLAVEIRASHIHPVTLTGRGGNWGRAFQRVMYWSHCRLLGLELRATDARARPARQRPPGVQVWVEDMHRRCFAGDFGPSRAGTVRFVGGVNGTYSAQLAVASDRELTALKVTASVLKRADGSGEIPAGAVSVAYMVAHPAAELVKLGQIRNMVEDRKDPLCPPAEWAVLRYGPDEARDRRPPRKRRLEILGKLRFFDHISPRAPAGVPGGTCQPVWLSLKIPADAAAGTYRGSLRVRADGIEPIDVPVRAEVIPWRVPDPADFQTVVALEQSPYGVARHYGAELWSDEHFRLIESSFRKLAGVGNDVLFIPCLQYTEFGNGQDTMVRWTREADGKLSFDFSVLDRYLALAGKHLGRGGDGPVICFVVMHGVDRWGPGAGLMTTVPVLDKASGKVGPLPLGNDTPGYRANWKAFATAVYDHMRSEGLAGRMLWGFCWDGWADVKLPPLLGELIPEVKWARSSHGGRPTGTFPLTITSLGRQITETGAAGWANPFMELLCPRSGSSVLSTNGHSPPLAFRLAAHRAVASGYRGIGRIGADYWADTFFLGYKGSLSGGIAGMPCSSVLWPGRDGAESGARFEAMREGVQETEAQTYLEQLLAAKRLAAAPAGRVRQALDEYSRRTLYVSPGRVGVQLHEYTADWQGRSGRLYRAAAEAAKHVPLDLDRTKIEASVRARARPRLAVKIRNWTAGPRQWQATTDTPWIVLPKSAGSVTGQHTLDVVVDTRRLQPGAKASGTLTVRDLGATSAPSYEVSVAVQVGKVFDLVMPAYDFLGAPGHASCWKAKRVEDHAVFNLPPGGADGGEYALVNLSGSPLEWKVATAAKWLTISPASGKLAPGQRAFVQLTARPPDKQAATRQAVLTVSEAPGGIALKRRIIAHVIPAYVKAALPEGDRVDLAALPKSRVKLHKSTTYWLGSSLRQRDDFGPRFGPNHQVHTAGAGAPPTAMHAMPEQITVYDVEGMGFTAFSAQAWIPPAYRKPSRSGTHRTRVNFEVHVDGKLRAQSGLMTPADEPRMMVAGGLAGARRVKLVTRFDRPEPGNLTAGIYVQWRQPRFHKGK